MYEYPEKLGRENEERDEDAGPYYEESRLIIPLFCPYCDNAADSLDAFYDHLNKHGSAATNPPQQP